MRPPIGASKETLDKSSRNNERRCKSGGGPCETASDISYNPCSLGRAESHGNFYHFLHLSRLPPPSLAHVPRRRRRPARTSFPDCAQFQNVCCHVRRTRCEFIAGCYDRADRSFSLPEIVVSHFHPNEPFVANEGKGREREGSMNQVCVIDNLEF